jgi:hypothetical protein
MFLMTALAMLFVGIGSDAMAQKAASVSKAKLVGTWSLVAVNNTTPDGKTAVTFDQGDGMIIFQRNGSFVQALIRSDLPKIASNNRATGTADENKAVVQGSLTYIGTYTVAKDGTLTLHLDRSTFANWNGTDQMRMITSLTGTELKWHNPAATVGGTTETEWKRVK